MESEQMDSEGKTSKWEQALQRLEITPEQRHVIDNAKVKEADDWSLEEADLIIRVSREARRLQAVDEYKALPRDEREREHQRVWQLIGGYTAFIAAACLAVISSSKWLHVVSCGTRQVHFAAAGTNGLAGRCLSLDIRR